MARKKQNQEEEKGGDVGLVMTCSLFLILLTFFILLNSIAVIDERRERKALASLIGAFGSLSGGLSPSRSGDSLIPPTAPMEENMSDMAQLLSIVDRRLIDNVQVQKNPKRRQESVSIDASALFLKSSLQLTTTARQLLDRIGTIIKAGNFQVEIIGHTDNREATEKGFRSNWEASALMAIEVARYLTRDVDVDPDRLTAYGRGDLFPRASNDTHAGRLKNRRVELLFDYQAPKFVKRIYRQKPAGIFNYKRFNFKVFN
jgi:chemotaxis protein MotB